MLRHPRFSGLYQLDIPNKEVRIGLMRSLLPNYVQRPAELNTLVAEKIYNGDMDDALVLMRTVLLHESPIARIRITRDITNNCFM